MQKVNVYANADEIQRMKEANPYLIQQMRAFMGNLKSMKKDTALEVACGECHVTRDYLQHEFFCIDLMDVCPESIKHAQMLKSKNSKIDLFNQCSMEDFIASKKYNCIVLRYAIGYLSDEKLVRFLTNCRVWLTENSSPSQRTCTRESFIIV